MDEEQTYPAPQRRPIVRKLAKEPSWLMLGFLLGAFFVWMLPTPAPKKAPPPPADDGKAEQSEANINLAQTDSAGLPSKAAKKKPVPLRRVTTIEAVFEMWGRYAVWEDNLTQVALWNAETGKFTECYEVVRLSEGLYFRSIPTLTRPVIDYGTQITSPLLYTETERTRAARARGEVPLPEPETARTETPPPWTPPRTEMSVPRTDMPAPQTPTKIEVPVPPPPRVEVPLPGPTP